MLNKQATTESFPLPIENAFKLFLKRTTPERLNRTVRKLFMEYLVHKHDFLPPDFHCHIDDLSNLFNLLDELTSQAKGWYIEEH